MFTDLLSLEVNLGLFYGALLVGVALFAGGLRNKTLGQYGKSSHQVFYINMFVHYNYSTEYTNIYFLSLVIFLSPLH